MPTSAHAIGTFERILMLKRSPVLAGLPPSELAVVAKHARERAFPKGSVVLREGEPVGAIYVVVDGKLHIARKGRTLGHATAGEGGGVGGVGLFARDAEGIQVVAEADTLTLELDADTVFEILEDHFGVLLHVLRWTCKDLIDALLRHPGELSRGVPGPQGIALPSRDLDLVDRIFFFRQTEPFSRSSINALAELSRGMAEVSFEPGATLFREGEPSRAVYLVVSGSVACTGAGFSFTSGAGQPLGSLDAVADRPRWYTALTETGVVALHGDVEGLIDVFEDNFEMALDYLAVLSRWLLQFSERVALERGALGRLYGCEHDEARPE